MERNTEKFYAHTHVYFKYVFFKNTKAFEKRVLGLTDFSFSFFFIVFINNSMRVNDF